VTAVETRLPRPVSRAPDDGSFCSVALDQEIALIEIGKRLSAERRAASARAKERSPSWMVTEKGSSDGHVAKDSSRLTQVELRRRSWISGYDHNLLQDTNISSSYCLAHRSQSGIKPAIESHISRMQLSDSSGSDQCDS
jgi:hypothetical protein